MARINENKFNVRGKIQTEKDAPELQLRKLKPGTSVDDAKAAMQGNKLDDVLFQTHEGDLYIASAAQIDTEDRFFTIAKKDDHIDIRGVGGKVLAVSDEWDRKQIAAAAATGGVAAGLLVGKSVIGEPAAMKNLVDVVVAAPLRYLDYMRGIFAGSAVASSGVALAVQNLFDQRQSTEKLNKLTASKQNVDPNMKYVVDINGEVSTKA